MVNIVALPDEATTAYRGSSKSLLKQASRNSSRLPRHTRVDAPVDDDSKTQSRPQYSPKSVRFQEETREPPNPRERRQSRGNRESNNSFSEESSDDEYWETVEYRERKPKRGFFGRLFSPSQERVVVTRRKSSRRRRRSSFSSDEESDYSTGTSDEYSYSDQTEQTDQTPQSLDYAPLPTRRRSDKRRRYVDTEQYDSEDSVDTKDVQNACSEVMYDTILMWKDPPPPPKKPLLLKGPSRKAAKPKSSEDAFAEAMYDTLFMWAGPPNPPNPAKTRLRIEGPKKERDEIEDNRSLASGYSERSMISWQRQNARSGPSKAACRSALDQLQKKKKIIQPPSLRKKQVEEPTSEPAVQTNPSPTTPSVDKESIADTAQMNKNSESLVHETESLDKLSHSEVPTEPTDPPTSVFPALSEDTPRIMPSMSEQSRTSFAKPSPSLDIPLAAKIPMALAGITMDRDEPRHDFVNLTPSPSSFDKCGKTVYNLYMTQINDPSLKKVADELSYLRSMLEAPQTAPVSQSEIIKSSKAAKQDPPVGEMQVAASKLPDPSGLVCPAMSENDLSMASASGQISVDDTVASSAQLKLEPSEAPSQGQMSTEDGLPSWYTKSSFPPATAQLSTEDGLPSWYANSELSFAAPSQDGLPSWYTKPAPSHMSTGDGLPSWYTNPESPAQAPFTTNERSSLSYGDTTSTQSAKARPRQTTTETGGLLGEEPKNKDSSNSTAVRHTSEGGDGSGKDVTSLISTGSRREGTTTLKEEKEEACTWEGYSRKLEKIIKSDKHISTCAEEMNQREAVADLVSRMRTKHVSASRGDSVTPLVKKSGTTVTGKSQKSLERGIQSKGSTEVVSPPASARTDECARKETKGVHTSGYDETKANKESASNTRKGVTSTRCSPSKNVSFSRRPVASCEKRSTSSQMHTQKAFSKRALAERSSESEMKCADSVASKQVPPSTVEAKSAAAEVSSHRNSSVLLQHETSSQAIAVEASHSAVEVAPKRNSSKDSRHERMSSKAPTNSDNSRSAQRQASTETATWTISGKATKKNISNTGRPEMTSREDSKLVGSKVSTRSSSSTVEAKRAALDEIHARVAAAAEEKRRAVSERRLKLEGAKARAAEASASIRASLEARRRKRAEAEGKLVDSLATVISSRTAPLDHPTHNNNNSTAVKGDSSLKDSNQSVDCARASNGKPNIGSARIRNFDKSNRESQKISTAGEGAKRVTPPVPKGRRELSERATRDEEIGSIATPHEKAKTTRKYKASSNDAFNGNDDEMSGLGAQYSTRRHSKIVALLEDIETHSVADSSRTCSTKQGTTESVTDEALGVNLTFSDLEAPEVQWHEEFRRVPVLAITQSTATLSKVTVSPERPVRSKARFVGRPSPESCSNRVRSSRRARKSSYRPHPEKLSK